MPNNKSKSSTIQPVDSQVANLDLDRPVDELFAAEEEEGDLPTDLDLDDDKDKDKEKEKEKEKEGDEDDKDKDKEGADKKKTEEGDDETSGDSDDDSDDESEKDSKDESKKDSKKDKLEADDSDDDPDKDKDKKADDDSVVGELAERFGIDTSKTTFEESIDGIVELTKAASEQLADQQLEALWKELPDVQQFAQFRLQGGKAEQFFETFFPQQDYSKLEVKEDNTTLQEQLIRTNLQLLGREDQDVTDTIDEFKTSGILHSQSQRALKDLAKHQVGEKERIIKERNEAALVATASQEDYLKEMKGAIKEAKDFKGFVITENDKDSLYDYVSTEIDNGQSQFQKDMEGAELEVYLAIAMLMRKGFNLDGLVSRRAATKNAQTLRDRLAKKQEKVRADEEKKKSENVTDVNVEDIDFSLG